MKPSQLASDWRAALDAARDHLNAAPVWQICELELQVHWEPNDLGLDGTEATDWFLDQVNGLSTYEANAMTGVLKDRGDGRPFVADWMIADVCPPPADDDQPLLAGGIALFLEPDADPAGAYAITDLFALLDVRGEIHLTGMTLQSHTRRLCRTDLALPRTMEPALEDPSECSACGADMLSSDHHDDCPYREQPEACPPTSGQDTMNVPTHPRFWECECDEDFVHPMSQENCVFCGAGREDQPDTSVDDPQKAGLL